MSGDLKSVSPRKAVPIESGYVNLEEAFPVVNPNFIPVGNKILLQIRTPKKKSSGGILLVEETREVDKWQSQVAKVITLGPVAFCNRNSLEKWPEGEWCNPGQFVRVPLYGGDRWYQKINPDDVNSDEAIFLVIKDTDVIGVVPDPLSVIAFIN
jgi:co-chaperonin GroES (HSP10)